MKLVIPLAIGAASMISLSSLMLIFFGMLPTVVAFIIDRSYQRSNTVCVGGANLCGVFPYLLDLWLKQHTVTGAMHILTDVFAIAVMYCAAAFGWLLFIAIPPIVASVLNVLAQHRVVHLRARQKKILEEWSKAVAEDVKESGVLKDQKSADGSEKAETPSDADETVPSGAAPAEKAA
ncbi:MAG: hypothetical protein RIB59_15385 [Rhodospirillales bacterium]